MDVVVIADRCEDATAMVARNRGWQCLERRDGQPGKGAAIAWAISELRNESVPFDALVMIDADTVADPGLLEAFNEGLSSGHQIQQAYNYISNPWETPFTRIIAVTSIMRNGLFYTGKAHLGLAGMLMGTGMCLGRQVIERHGWTAFSVGEDWEFSVFLLLRGEMIYFNPMARVLAKESTGFKHAWTQRLRWASGRHAVAASGAWELFFTGLRQRRVYLLDAALTLLAPNYSSQAALAVFALIASWFVSGYPAWRFLFPWATLVITSLGAYFLAGVALSQSPMRALTGIALIPLFVPWRMTIEVMGLLGYGRKQWHRTPRVPGGRQGSGS
jgi:cellulose synthase/poly-beta-1,6-N-acetylglucosamine synthase-like glycosyltransferase